MLFFFLRAGGSLPSPPQTPLSRPGSLRDVWIYSTSDTAHVLNADEKHSIRYNKYMKCIFKASSDTTIILWKHMLSLHICTEIVHLHNICVVSDGVFLNMYVKYVLYLMEC